MPKKRTREGYKIWSCSCSKTGYLCTFQVYDGKPVDPVTHKKISERGLVKRVVHELLAGFTELNHVVYMDNFYTSGEVAEELAKDKIYIAGTIKPDAKGFPAELKNVTPSKGEYAAYRSGDIVYYVFHDRKVVRFISNVFPEAMNNPVPRMQPNGVFQYQSVPPLLPAYNKYMGGVDLTDQLRKTYGFDRKSKRAWIRLFYCFFDLAINNAFILHRTSLQKKGPCPLKSLDFRLELARGDSPLAFG